jgi:cysteine desulfurase
VLQAIGVPPDLARGAVRVSLGETTQAADVDGLLQTLRITLDQLRHLPAMERAALVSAA